MDHKTSLKCKFFEIEIYRVNVPGPCTFAFIHFSFFNPEMKYGKCSFFFNGSNTDE